MQSCIANDTRLVYPVLEQLNAKDAVVTAVRGLILPEEAEHLKNIAQGKFSQSSVSSDGNDGKVDNNVRTSTTAFLEKGADPVVSCIEQRLATIAGQSVSHLEPLQVTDYRHKQQYKYHHDYFNSKDGNSERTTTIFAYLHSENLEHGQCGGSTMFRDLKDAKGDQLKVYPKMGDAVMWSNRTLTGGLNEKTLHSGEPLTCDSSRKTGLNAWFRDGTW